VKPADHVRLAWGSVRSHPARTVLVLVAMAIGVAAVLVLTALADAARRYVTDQLAGLGSNLLVVMPGKVETRGIAVPMTSDVPRPLTLDDALVVAREPTIVDWAPIVFGLAPVRAQGREREVGVLGTTASMLALRRLTVAQGTFLAAGDPRTAHAECVLGAKLRDELFGPGRGVGEWVRIADRRFRVVGVLASKGTTLGMDMDDLAIVPVAQAFALFDTDALFRLMLQARSRDAIPAAERAAVATLRTLHGEEDFTVVTQDALLGALDSVLAMVTFVLAGIAGIALLVAGVLVLNVMVVVVSRRTAEVGLLKALGATAREVRALFLTEALLLSAAGSVLGTATGYALAFALGSLWPALAGGPPGWATAAAALVAVGAGAVFGVAPANRAARLDPVQALARR